jgi:septal ring factor EnvC (AmiA/AmiB activator)
MINRYVLALLDQLRLLTERLIDFFLKGTKIMSTITELTESVTAVNDALLAVDAKLDEVKAKIDELVTQVGAGSPATQAQLDALGELLSAAKLEGAKVLAEASDLVAPVTPTP